MKLLTAFYIISSFLFLGCDSKKEKEDSAQKQFKRGTEYAAPIVTLFNKGELNQAAAAFAAISKNPLLTPVMKLEGYTYVYYSFERLNRLDSALMYQDSCINIIEQNHLEKILVNQYWGYLMSKSASLFSLHQPEKANAIFFKVKQEVERSDSNMSKIFVFEKLGFIAYRQKNFKEALDNFKKVEKFQNKTYPNDYYKNAEIADNIGLCYFHLKQYDSALVTYKNGLRILDSHSQQVAKYITTKEGNLKAYNHSRGVLIGNIAHLYMEAEQYDSAIAYSKQSIALNSEQEGERLDAQIVAMRLADVYIKIKKWGEAETMLQQINSSLYSLPDAVVRMNWHRQMATVLENRNKPDKAYAHFKAFNATKDSLNKLELQDAENNIVKDLQIKNQESDLSLLKKDNELNQLYIWISVGLIIIAIAVALLIFTNYKKGKRKNEQLMQLNNEVTMQQQKTEIALQQLSISNKDKDRILRVVAHDLRNPLSGIAAVSKTILEDEDMPNKKMLQMIEQTSNNTLSLINELLQNHTTANVHLEKTATNINALIQNAYSLLKHKADDKQQNLKINLPEQGLMLLVDAPKIERVISNLIGNAIKFTPIEGTIHISASTSNETFVVSVKDNGLGIDKANQQSIFEPFNNARRSGTAGEKSFGLGLSVCKEIVEAHQGTIWVESEVGKGSVFYISLPIT